MTPEIRSIRGSLAPIRAAVAPAVAGALEASVHALEQQSIPHLLIGGLAVAAHGYIRATRDVDYLVGDQAFVHHGGGLVSIRAGLPFRVGEVAVDLIGIPTGISDRARECLQRALARGPGVVPLEDLVYLKLHANRPRDQGDVVGLLQAGVIELDAVIEHLRVDYQDEALVARFERLVAKAIQER